MGLGYSEGMSKPRIDIAIKPMAIRTFLGRYLLVTS